MSSAEYGNQFINENPDVSITDILKDSTEIEIQSVVDVPIHQEDSVVQRTPLVDTVISMIPEKSTPTPPTIEAQATNVSESNSSSKIMQRLSKLKKKVEALSKIDHDEAVKESVQANVINEVKNQLPKLLPKAMSDYVQSSSTQVDSLTKHERKNRLFDKMQKSGSFLKHEKRLE
ncbi:hypothetical protein Tco_0034005 [Tanacetum coccineum]